MSSALLGAGGGPGQLGPWGRNSKQLTGRQAAPQGGREDVHRSAEGLAAFELKAQVDVEEQLGAQTPEPGHPLGVILGRLLIIIVYHCIEFK